VEVTNGHVSNEVRVSTRADGESFSLAPGEVRALELDAGAGVPYKPAQYPTNYVYAVSVSAEAGFVPFLEDQKSPDSRYLGVMVRLVPVYFN
jgi:hypothetical protein